MAISSPKDKYGGVWLIFFMLGLGTLLPWNFFMTATVYFTGRLKDSSLDVSSANQTEAAGEQRSVLEAKFNNVMTLCAMLPLLLCTCLNSFLHSLIPQRLRVMGSLLVIMFVFAVTAVLVKVPLEPLPFFSVTMVKIVIINSFGAVLQGSLFGMAGLLPASYTTPIMSGQGLAGTFAAFAMICAIASGSEMQEAAFGYFITACAVIFLSVLSYILLPRLEFFQFYQERNQKQTTSDEEQNSVSLMNRENKDEAADQKIQDVSMMNIFKKIWILALSVCFTFTITIGTFPAITADTQSTLADVGSWDLYFIPVSCFLLFNLSDWGGRSLTAICMWPGKHSRILPVLILCRLAFVPLFMLCNVQPRLHLPIFFHHDGFFIVFMILFAFTNGYLASLCMCYGPKNVLPHEAETAGAIMAFFLSLGLALGAALSFLLRALV
ncbi:equilibrative nucleoside transporter 1-like [Amphiprion ocellaris]|uniref:Solute carrier family 29 member 1b n=1 Tax=Amphiprion ocellaris TaxID=80972 RepID=A0A3Q1CTC8_AMPOC|nr:equilibrative nucleoside transporter 1-like [Amphiprion ocellaris]XP_023119008.2 equilibrative nucleoside transporter 1-like [Amphiprion ocellaris]XP_035800826.2 equilibrative nucleoside transporter 1-like [Amphiprion ocellaris]